MVDQNQVGIEEWDKNQPASQRPVVNQLVVQRICLRLTVQPVRKIVCCHFDQTPTSQFIVVTALPKRTPTTRALTVALPRHPEVNVHHGTTEK